MPRSKEQLKTLIYTKIADPRTAWYGCVSGGMHNFGLGFQVVANDLERFRPTDITIDELELLEELVDQLNQLSEHLEIRLDAPETSAVSMRVEVTNKSTTLPGLLVSILEMNVAENNQRRACP